MQTYARSARRPEAQAKPASRNTPRTVQLKPLLDTRRDAQSGVPPLVAEALRSFGNPLDRATRIAMESCFGDDFSTVRVHTGADARAAAEGLGARAFTSGDDIAFGTGEYAPHTDSGRRLLAHELAHVVQQRAGAPLSGGAGHADDAFELHAEAAAGAVVAGQQHVATGNSASAAHPSVQCQVKTAAGQPAVEHAAPKQDLIALIARFKSRLAFLIKQYLTLQDAYDRVKEHPASASTQAYVHAALASAFIAHNPGSRITSVNEDLAGIDVREIPSWKADSGDGRSRGTALGTDTAYAQFFPTGPGTVWLSRAGVQLNPHAYRNFLWRTGNVPERELAELLDPWYVRKWHDFLDWDATIDNGSHEAPAAIQFIADINPLVAVAKIISVFKEGTPLFARPGTKATTADKAEAIFGLVAGAESVAGEAIADVVKGARAAQLLNVARKAANPLGHLSDAIVESWTKDQVLRAALAGIVEWHLDKAVWDGVIHPLAEHGGPKAHGGP